PLAEAVVDGASERLRPVLMTATIATFGMLPAALAIGVGSDVQRNVGTVVAGGLLPATLLTLFIVPTLYFVIEQRMLRRVQARLPQMLAVILIALAGWPTIPAVNRGVARPQHIATERMPASYTGHETLYPRLASAADVRSASASSVWRRARVA